jgi:hypothetical protein
LFKPDYALPGVRDIENDIHISVIRYEELSDGTVGCQLSMSYAGYRSNNIFYFDIFKDSKLNIYLSYYNLEALVKFFHFDDEDTTGILHVLYGIYLSIVSAWFKSEIASLKAVFRIKEPEFQFKSLEYQKYIILYSKIARANSNTDIQLEI